MVFRCNDCGHIFDEGEEYTWQESRGEFWGSPCSETLSGCPICKESYSEVFPCKICGSYACEDGEDFCENCQVDVQKRFKAMLDEFTMEERELLNELYGMEL